MLEIKRGCLSKAASFCARIAQVEDAFQRGLATNQAANCTETIEET
ncbi:MAG: hypothetical protein AVDCRST_MAG96-1264 [uncultured Segetibacter sp.]|uniref:Uncharacterized protein n=1 Tax=uncultured Segetibacter sp. TaxID=481133 RepID=A0A6J4S9B4_9BACT|nr:MAG: hypothetical protein AVDCRST_MAG96-1264 [uncultured Segetibacter sp.]